ncbi:LEF-10 [Parapoynx stagnalis nucleopolyhedrovirus]|uniref:LEF-10 n=1 Tax=Parapoynx stagnalis nucleopolyhedrovirus TaxID=2993413 RepID=A0A9E8BWF6_9ABAC|nr:LEF-10 [Parapoynx stagnalis nucleopolyhedrovirus]
MNCASAVSDNEIVDLILKDNLYLIDNNYIILNVVEKEISEIRSMCLGEIDSIQTHARAHAHAMLDASSSSELQSSTSSQ